MRYFFKFDAAGELRNWQISEGNGDQLRAAGYIEVTKVRYMAFWQEQDRRCVALIKAAIQPQQERTV